MMNLNPFTTTVFPTKSTQIVIPPEPEELPDPTNVVVAQDFTYVSSIDPINNLYTGVAYKDDRIKKPICVLMHGYNGVASDYYPTTAKEFAEYGFFSVAVGMRGRDGASRLKDDNGRELYDIIDAVEYVKRMYPTEVDENNIVIAGYSGGGANAMALACKFPDYFNAYAAHFGISDFWYNDVWSWGVTHTSRQSSMNARIGIRSENINPYWSRAVWQGIPRNLKGGFIYLYHDEGDGVVGYTQTTGVASEMDRLGRTNYFMDITDATDNPRWLHQQPTASSQVIATRDRWGQKIKDNLHLPWTIPESGDMLIQGYLVTKRFEIWLGNGQDHVAELVYDTLNYSYTITPLTGSVEIVITQGKKTTVQTISTVTTLIVS